MKKCQHPLPSAANCVKPINCAQNLLQTISILQTDQMAEMYNVAHVRNKEKKTFKDLFVIVTLYY